ncbi:MAG: hypothetical protein ABIL09_14930 [Gemmatimonadota bacterium]
MSVPGSTATFRLEALTDFVDDALAVSFTERHVDSMMATLAGMGVARVSWAYYGDGHGGFAVPVGLDDRWARLAETYRVLGNPLRVAAAAAHRHGLELYAYYKPYETGPAICLPEGSPEAEAYGLVPHRGGSLAWMDPFVARHPELRLRRRPDAGLGDRTGAPVRALRLTKQDAAPTRITADHLQIWTSARNYRYQPLPVPFAVRDEVVPSPRDVDDIRGTRLTRRGDPVRTLTLTGLSLTDSYILVTTDFGAGPADFANAGTDILTALDEAGREIPGVPFSGAMIYLADRIDFRNHGLVFDCGYGRSLAHLDEPNATGKRGCVAFARGRNEYLPGALCETEPAVQAFWLACLEEMIAAGVDGVDLRVENHGTHTEYPEEYGFNEVILEQCRRRGQADLETIAAVRGAAYTAFLRQARQRLRARGRAMRLNLNLDWFRAEPPASRRLAYPANITYDWRRWLDAGRLDEGILRLFALPFDAVFDDAVAGEMIARCREKGIPLVVNRYIQPTGAEEFERVRQDGRFAGFILYETASYLTFDAGGSCSVSHAAAAEVARRQLRSP